MKFNKDKAIYQYEEAVKEVQKTLKERPELNKLANAIMKLRNLSLNKREQLREVLYMGDTAASSFLVWFGIVLDADDELRLPDALNNLLHMLSYNIVDDGYLMLYKVELQALDDEALTDTAYFLCTDEDWEHEEDITDRWLEKGLSFIGNASDAKVVSEELTSFHGSLEKFTQFIEDIARKTSWTSKNFFNPGEDFDKKFFHNDH